jgi:hypothetical protein
MLWKMAVGRSSVLYVVSRNHNLVRRGIVAIMGLCSSCRPPEYPTAWSSSAVGGGKMPHQKDQVAEARAGSVQQLASSAELHLVKTNESCSVLGSCVCSRARASSSESQRVNLPAKALARNRKSCDLANRLFRRPDDRPDRLRVLVRGLTQRRTSNPAYDLTTWYYFHFLSTLTALRDIFTWD